MIEESAQGDRADIRSRVIDVAIRTLREGGRSALTTRGVAEAAGTQAPTIYRLFGDKDGLLDAVAERVMTDYFSAKVRAAAIELTGESDPVDDLRAGWRAQIEFGLANPELFALLNDPSRDVRTPAFHAAVEVLEARVHRLALTGRLAVGEDRAILLIRAAGTGAVSTILSSPPDRRDPALAEEMFDVVARAILVDDGAVRDDRLLVAAVTVRAGVPDLAVLSDAEQRLLTEWLDRAIGHLRA